MLTLKTTKLARRAVLFFTIHAQCIKRYVLFSMQPIGKNTFLTLLHLSYFYKTTNHFIANSTVFKDSNQVCKYFYEILKKYRKHFYGNCFLQAAHIQQRLHCVLIITAKVLNMTFIFTFSEAIIYE